MSDLINPSTGLPMGRQFSISSEDLMKILTTQRIKIDLLNQQNMQLGLYVEFIVTNLQKMVDPEGNNLFDIDISEFPAFAEKRMGEIQTEIAEHHAKNETQAAQEVMDVIPQALEGILLNE